ncbi:MAG: CYTH domain-containing protein [candidate division Zixibacteria bacterium]|nr:CYTH domain-containing protein [candidate division Zixibacteria bacterium]
MMLPQEIEIKLDLQKEENYTRLIERFKIAKKPTRQENYFFDSEDMTLSKNGWALRLRIEKDKSSLTLKGTTTQSSGGLAIRDEIEISIPDENGIKYSENGLRDSNIPSEIASIIRPIIKTSDLVQKVYFINDRFRINYSDDDIGLLFEIDKTEFSDGSIDYELEVELKDQLIYQKALGRITAFLDSVKIVTVFQKQSKFARALMVEGKSK